MNKVVKVPTPAPTDAARRERSDQRNRAALRALVIPLHKNIPDPAVDIAKAGAPGQSKAITEDPFMALGHEGRIIEPPFDLLTLAMLPEQNTELTPVVETMEANVDGFGHHLTPRVDLKKVEDEKERARLRREIHAEKVRLTNFFNYASFKDSFTQLRKKKTKDLETTGNAYWEVIRSLTGDVQGFEHLPSYQMRLGRQDNDQVQVEIPTLQLQEDGSFVVSNMLTWQRFRKYVQSRLTPYRGLHASVTSGSFKVRWFKEFGDPRVYDNESGDIVPPEKVADWDGKGNPMPDARRANEVVHYQIHSTRSPYGLPRFVGTLLSIYGARAAEEINYITFQNHNIPSMVVLVSNGQLTEGSIERIESFVESQIQQSSNYSKFLILEAEGVLEGEDAGQIKMEIKPLTQAQIKDALFQVYTKNNQDNVRRSFRLPPIFVGKSDDYTRATADSSRRLADEQVFAPMRDEFDEWINRMLFPAMGIVFHKFKSNSPNTTDNMELVRILGGAEKTGGMTPEIARLILEDILGRELPDFPQDDRFDPSMPFSLLMAEAVKNNADPTEPGQQLTALKSIGFLDDADPFEPTVEEMVVTHLNKIRNRLEASWETRLLDAATGHGIDLDGEEPPL